MKIIDRYILTSFLSTFTTVFVILFFIFILYALWLFIPDLAGKGLEIWLVVKFLSYVMPTLIPVIMPLTILLAAIMTFGAFGENYEFAAMKSAGLSLRRISRSLLLFIVLLSGFTFFIANDVIPYSKYKVNNFRANLKEKPSMAIIEGQFSEVGIYNIKVDKKSGKDGRLLEDVIIHKRTKYGKNTTVTKAKNGELVSKENSNILQLVLYDGHHYEDIISTKIEDRNKKQFAKADFEKYIINIDLSGLMNIDLDSSNENETNDLLNASELLYTIDSLKVALEKEKKSYIDNTYYRTSSALQTNKGARLIKDPSKISINETAFEGENLIDILPSDQKSLMFEAAYNNLLGSKYNISESRYNLEYQDKNLKSHQFALHEKFAIAYSCLLMFFIGAPLGAIIRKGGFGMPIVFAMIIYVAFHFTSTFGRKVAQDGTLDAFLGAWGSAIVLTPLAVLLTYRATNDKGMSVDKLTLPIQDFFKKIFKTKQNKKHV